jgi:chemotaxis protein methyltransferase CheR
MAITDREFQLLSELIYKHFGIHLTEAKRSLLVRRLQSLLKKEGLSTFREYYDRLVANPDAATMTELVNRITTNYTYFYREPEHFDFFLKKALPEIVARHKQHHSRDLLVWCAAASTGEEPYMLAMLMMEYLGPDYGTWDAGLLATDISEKALKKAVVGIYPESETKTMPKHLVKKYFTKHGENQVKVIPRLSREVMYRRFNLITPRFPWKRPFDVIFCRNVMIYFDNETKLKLIQQIYDSLNYGGYLFIGHSESLMRMETPLRYIMPAVYQKV